MHERLGFSDVLFCLTLAAVLEFALATLGCYLFGMIDFGKQSLLFAWQALAICFIFAISSGIWSFIFKKAVMNKIYRNKYGIDDAFYHTGWTIYHSTGQVVGNFSSKYDRISAKYFWGAYLAVGLLFALSRLPYLSHAPETKNLSLSLLMAALAWPARLSLGVRHFLF